MTTPLPHPAHRRSLLPLLPLCVPLILSLVPLVSGGAFNMPGPDDGSAGGGATIPPNAGVQPPPPYNTIQWVVDDGTGDTGMGCDEAEAVKAGRQCFFGVEVAFAQVCNSPCYWGGLCNRRRCVRQRGDCLFTCPEEFGCSYGYCVRRSLETQFLTALEPYLYSTLALRQPSGGNGTVHPLYAPAASSPTEAELNDAGIGGEWSGDADNNGVPDGPVSGGGGSGSNSGSGSDGGGHDHGGDDDHNGGASGGESSPNASTGTDSTTSTTTGTDTDSSTGAGNPGSPTSQPSGGDAATSSNSGSEGSLSGSSSGAGVPVIPPITNSSDTSSSGGQGEGPVEGGGDGVLTPDSSGGKGLQMEPESPVLLLLLFFVATLVLTY